MSEQAKPTLDIYNAHNACMFRGECRKQADEIATLRAAHEAAASPGAEASR